MEEAHKKYLRDNGAFLSVKEMQKITGSKSYEATRQHHVTIRDSIAAKKRKLTLKEYCDFEGLDYIEILDFLTS